MAEKDEFLDPEKNSNIPLLIFFKNARMVFKLDELGLEIAQIALPAAMALAADPVASLVDTAFIGHIGPIELAAVGVSIALFNQVSRIVIFPLVSITTSFVAEEDAKSTPNTPSKDLELASNSFDNETKELLSQADSGESNQESNSETPEIDMPMNHKRHIPSASSALIIGTILGILQTIFLISLAKPLLKYMGINSDSPMLPPAQKYLSLRSLGAPAVLLSLAMQGVFRGFKDTKTPLYATIAGDATNIILDPIFIFVFRMGVSGAAIAHVISQYLMSAILFWRLLQQINLFPPHFKDLQFSRFLKNGICHLYMKDCIQKSMLYSSLLNSGGLLLMRVVAATFCVTLAASMAAHQGPTPMAAFQVCLQVWLTTSLLADGLAVAAQAILASAFANSDYEKARSTASRVLQLGFILGLVLAIMLGFGLHFGAKLFTKDDNVLDLISTGIPFVALTQPINALAFVFDGINFGASDFAYSGYSMVTVAIFSFFCLLVLSLRHGFVGIWFALAIFMSLRAFAGFWRIGTGSGPWKFLRS